MVQIVLVGIDGGKTGHRRVEYIPRAEVGSDGRRVPGASVRPSEGPAADLRICPHEIGGHSLDRGRDLPIPQLAHVVVMGDAVDGIDDFDAVPTEHDVTGRLHETLPFNDPTSVVGEPAFGGPLLED